MICLIASSTMIVVMVHKSFGIPALILLPFGCDKYTMRCHLCGWCDFGITPKRLMWYCSNASRGNGPLPSIFWLPLTSIGPPRQGDPRLADRHLLVMEWKNGLFIDTCLPFGLHSAPKLFNLLADLLQWVLKNHVCGTISTIFWQCVPQALTTASATWSCSSKYVSWWGSPLQWRRWRAQTLHWNS